MRTTITAFLAALILPGLSMAAADEAKTITATHTLGTVELPVNPKRVAVLDYGSLETISELGVTPALALPKKFLPPYLSKFSGEQYTDLGTVKEFNIETINAFKPDLFQDVSRIIIRNFPPSPPFTWSIFWPRISWGKPRKTSGFWVMYSACPKRQPKPSKTLMKP